MGGAFELMVWYLSVIYLLTGFLPAFLTVFILYKFFSKSAFIQLYFQKFYLTFPVAALLLLFFQFYTLIDSNSYFTNLAAAISQRTIFILIFIVSVAPLFFLFSKRNRSNSIALILLSLVFLLLIIVEQLYPFIPLDSYVLSKLAEAIFKSTLFYIVLGMLITFSVIFRQKMERQ